MTKGNTVIIEKGSGSGGTIVALAGIAVIGYLGFKALPWIIGAEVASTVVEEGKKAVESQTKKTTEASKVSIDIGTKEVPAPVTYHYDYKQSYEDLPIVPKALVGTGMATSEWTGIDAAKKGAELRSQFETRMIQNESSTKRFNELPAPLRILVRSGEGITNLFGVSAYQAGFDTRKTLQSWFK